MAQNRYVKDYRLVETVDERGRIHTDYEYIGDSYYYLRGAETARKEKRTVLTVCLAAWLAFVGALLPNSGGMHTLWVTLPFLFTALALGILTETLLTATPNREPFERRQADKLENRYPTAALSAAVLTGISLLGEGLNLLLRRPMNGGDAVFCLCAAVVAGCAVFVFSRRGSFACRKGGK